MEENYHGYVSQLLAAHHPLLFDNELESLINRSTFLIRFPSRQLPGQKASACTCPGEDHPGPNVRVGRGAPESTSLCSRSYHWHELASDLRVHSLVDIIEGQVDYRGVGSASQSIQVAPIDAGYAWKNSTPDTVVCQYLSPSAPLSSSIEQHDGSLIFYVCLT